MKKTNSGVTLIALIITIIVLLILAGVTIAMIMGDNGILNRAADASEQTEIAEEKEAINLAYVGALAKENGGEISQTTLEEELANYFETGKYAVEPGTNDDGTEGYIVIITENDPNGRTYFVDKNGNIIEGWTITPEKTDGSYSANKGVNTPKIDEENGMQLVKYDEETQTWVEDTTKSEYSYVAQTGTTENGGTSEWANAKVTIDGVESYFVWIPRYAYKIDSTNQTIDVKFLKDTGVEATDGTICKYANDSTLNTSTDYIIHPAFTADVENGGWDTELSGLWIGKYETSKVNGTTNIKIEPGVSSWGGITIGEMYSYALNYSTNLQSHMLKNSEWGVVAYLTHSQYGRNKTEVTHNQNSSFLTGYSNSTDAYNTEKGVLASSTGNVYGIYDMSGGKYELVASYYNGSSNLANGNSFASSDGTSTKYATAYTNTTVNSAYKYGDATYETRGWNDDYAGFISSTAPFFDRGGGMYDSLTLNGIFQYTNANGDASYSYYTFRVCLVVE